jgi:hypothetical protein
MMREMANKRHILRSSEMVRASLGVACVTLFIGACQSSGAGWFGKEEEKKEKNWRAQPSERKANSTLEERPETEFAPNPSDRNEEIKTNFNVATTPDELQRGQYVPIEIIYVNNDAILAEEVVEPLVPVLRETLKAAGQGDPQALIVRNVSIEVRSQVDNLLMYQEYGRRVTEPQQKIIEKVADKEIKNYINKYFAGREARYAKYLENLGLSLEKVRQRRQRQLVVIKNLQDQYWPMVRPPRRSEMVSYYESHQNDFQQADKIDLYLIESPFGQPQSGANIEQAMAKRIAREHIEKAKAELDAGMFFDAVAKKYGTDFLKNRGGRWGVITAPIPEPRWKNASEIAFGLKENEVSEVIEGSEGFFIVKCGKRTGGMNVSFEQAQPKIEEQFRDIQFNRMVAKARDELIQKANIRGDLNGLVMEVTERLNQLLESDQLTKGP